MGIGLGCLFMISSVTLRKVTVKPSTCKVKQAHHFDPLYTYDIINQVKHFTETPFTDLILIDLKCDPKYILLIWNSITELSTLNKTLTFFLEANLLIRA